MNAGVFLPERLRPAVAARRSRRPLLLLLVPPLVLLVLPMWQVQAVEISPCPELPAEARVALRELAGSSVLTLDLEWVRHYVEQWPCVSGVDVHFELPSKLLVRVEAVQPGGSVPAGRGWHAVGRNGALAGPLTSPMEPIFLGFRAARGELRAGLQAVERVQLGSGGRVTSVRRITPTDLQMRVIFEGQAPASMTVHVRPGGSASETFWSGVLRRNEVHGKNFDLRRDDRMVISSTGWAP